MRFSVVIAVYNGSETIAEQLDALAEQDAARSVEVIVAEDRAGTPLVLVSDAVIHYRHRHRLRDLFKQTRGYGRGSARLQKRYGPLGLARTTPREAVVAWARLLARLPRLVTSSRERRAAWVVLLGWQLGRLEGSLRERVSAL
jgi:GT2 family glycosyltransferase